MRTGRWSKHEQEMVEERATILEPPYGKGFESNTRHYEQDLLGNMGSHRA
jgi:hypothetical protein